MILPIKSEMTSAKNQCLCLCFCIELSLRLPSFKVRVLQMIINFAFVLINISSRHSNLHLLTNLLLYIDCSKIARIRNKTRSCTKEKPYMFIRIFFFFCKFVKAMFIRIFCKFVKAKKVNRLDNIHM